MESILTKAIFSAQQSKIAFSKYITANDTGSTGGHQAGFHIHKHSWENRVKRHRTSAHSQNFQKISSIQFIHGLVSVQ